MKNNSNWFNNISSRRDKTNSANIFITLLSFMIHNKDK